MSDMLYESQRILVTNNSERIKITSSTDVENLKQVQDIKDQLQEHLLVITLNNKQFVNSIELVAKGSMTRIQADVSDVVRCAILRGSTSIIVVHNHPSGDSTPSKHDLYFTKKLNTIASYLNISLLDHLIIGERTFSMKKEKLIDMDSEFTKLENSVIDEMRKANIELRSKISEIEKKESISEKVERVIEKLKISKHKEMREDMGNMENDEMVQDMIKEIIQELSESNNKSIQEKMQNAKEKSKEQISNSRGRDPLKNERADSTL